MRSVLTICLLIILILANCGASRASQSSGWLSNNISVVRVSEPSSNQLPTTVSLSGNVPCTNQEFVIRPEIVPIQSKQTAEACAVTSIHGQVASGGYTNVLGQDARLLDSGGQSISFFAVPGGLGGIKLEYTSKGWKAHYYSDWVQALERDFNPETGILKLSLSGKQDWTLSDKSGKNLYVRPESITFSNNGQWMVVDTESLAMLRVRLSDGQVTPFSTHYNYNVGLSVAPNLAISDDGQTVARTSSLGDLRLIDVQSCPPVPDSINGALSCDTVLRDGLLRNQVTNYRRVYQPRFVGNDQINLIVSHKIDGVSTLTNFKLLKSGTNNYSTDYLAMGDSYTSGEGAYWYFPETDSDSNKCHLSKKSYPFLISKQLGIDSFHSVACSGARIEDITHVAQKPNEPSENNLNEWLPGRHSQIQYLSRSSPGIVTVSISGNDVGLISKMKACFGPGTCYPYYEDREEMLREVDRQFPRLVDTFQQIKANTKLGSRIFAIGYPMVFNDQQQCPIDIPLNRSERKLINQMIQYINNVINIAANKAGISYIDVTNSFQGYELCSTTQPKKALNGLVLGDDLPFSFGPFGNESFHPKTLGHQLYKAKIISESQSLTRTSLGASHDTSLPNSNEGLEMLDVPRKNRELRQIYFDSNLTTDYIEKGKTISLKTDPSNYLLSPNSTLNVEIHSEPQVIGSLDVNSQGYGQTTLELPNELQPGFHEIHLIGKDLLDQPIDIYKTFYFAEDKHEKKVATTLEPQLPQLGLYGTITDTGSPVFSTAVLSNKVKAKVEKSHKSFSGFTNQILWKHSGEILVIAGLSGLAGIKLARRRQITKFIHR